MQRLSSRAAKAEHAIYATHGTSSTHPFTRSNAITRLQAIKPRIQILHVDNFRIVAVQKSLRLKCYRTTEMGNVLPNANASGPSCTPAVGAALLAHAASR